MKNLNGVFGIVVLLVLVTGNAAWARGGHRHGQGHLNFSIHIGGYNHGFYGSRYFSPGFYGYRSHGFPGPSLNGSSRYRYLPRMAAPVVPAVYIEREQTGRMQPEMNYWHYCRNPGGYYPTVESCPDGWIQVAPRKAMQ